jgi:putative membrane protein
MSTCNSLKYKLVTVVLTGMLIAGIFSCTGTGNTSDAAKTESMIIKDNMDNTMSVSTNGIDLTKINNTDTDKNNAERDAVFMMNVAEINMEEIKLGNLAQQKSKMPHVKEYGDMMVTEHTQAMTSLSNLASTKMVNLPTTESKKIMDAYSMLSTKTGKDFDVAYSNMMVKGHQEAIALFETENNNTNDEEVKAMIATILPALKTHLKHAEICQKECEKM